MSTDALRTPRREWVAILAIGLLVTVASGGATGARAVRFAQTTADEPQYLLSAISLAEDGDLDIADELAAERWREFHEAALPVQTEPLPDGREVSPHDPLLPLLLAPGMAMGGWVGAKLTLAAMAGALASLTVWTARRRLDVPLGVAVVVVAACSLSVPLVAYGTQVYPELPAGFAVMVVLAAATGRLRAPALAVALGALVALPWLSVKYAPVVVALGALVGWRVWRAHGWRGVSASGAVVALAAVVFVVVHEAIYTGLTPYAAGDHFVGGELEVMGTRPNRLARSIRLIGLFADRDFGLVAWAPVWLLLLPALGALVRCRPPGWDLLVAALAAGFATATWIALTMHGWWFPGRQVVVVLPAATLVIAWWAARVRWAPTVAGIAGLIGFATWSWLVAEVVAGRRSLVYDFADTRSPWFRLVHPLLPDGRGIGATRVGFVVWGIVLVGLLAWGWWFEGISSVRSAGRPRSEAAAPAGPP